MAGDSAPVSTGLLYVRAPQDLAEAYTVRAKQYRRREETCREYAELCEREAKRYQGHVEEPEKHAQVSQFLIA